MEQIMEDVLNVCRWYQDKFNLPKVIVLWTFQDMVIVNGGTKIYLVIHQSIKYSLFNRSVNIPTLLVHFFL